MIPVHLAIDLEPDERLPALGLGPGAGGLEAAGRALEAMARWRGRLEEATGAPVRFGWYLRMDRHMGAVFGDPLARAPRPERALDAAMAAGDEIGLHVHCGEPSARGGWRVNYADAALVDDTIDEAAAAFARCFGRPARAARMGDMFASARTLATFDALGVEVDLSLEQGLRAASMRGDYPGTDSIGARPSLLAVPPRPYRPSTRNVRRPAENERDSLGLWAAPLTSYPARGCADPRVWALSALSAAVTGFKSPWARRVIRPQSERTQADLGRALAAALDSAPQAPLCTAIRNFKHEDRIARFLGALAARGRTLRFVAPDEYVKRAAQKQSAGAPVSEPPAPPG
ncbi:MAG: hypothetical protein RIE56_14215 [Amphiplicatus sp.]